MSFSTEISYYAGSTGGHTAQVNKYVQNGIQWVISQIEKTNPDLLSLFAKIQTLNNTAPTLTLSTNSKILDVVRDSADANGVSRDTQIITNVQNNNVDGRKDIVLTEAGLEIQLPETHTLLKFS